MPTYRNDNSYTVRLFDQNIIPGQLIEVDFAILNNGFTLVSSSYKSNTFFRKNDLFTGLPVWLNDDHAAVHQGIAYALWNYDSVANGENLYIELKTPANTY